MGSVISGLCLIWGGGEAWGALPLLLASPMVFVLRVVSGEGLAGTRGAGGLWIDNLCPCPSEACLGMLLTPLGGGAVRSM